MNVLKPDLQTTIKILLSKGVSQRQIERKTGIERKTIRRYGQSFNLMASPESEHSKSPTEQEVATGSLDFAIQNPPPRPPAQVPHFAVVLEDLWVSNLSKSARGTFESPGRNLPHFFNGLSLGEDGIPQCLGLVAALSRFFHNEDNLAAHS